MSAVIKALAEVESTAYTTVQTILATEICVTKTQVLEGGGEFAHCFNVWRIFPILRMGLRAWAPYWMKKDKGQGSFALI